MAFFGLPKATVLLINIPHWIQEVAYVKPYISGEVRTKKSELILK